MHLSSVATSGASAPPVRLLIRIVCSYGASSRQTHRNSRRTGSRDAPEQQTHRKSPPTSGASQPTEKHLENNFVTQFVKVVTPSFSDAPEIETNRRDGVSVGAYDFEPRLPHRVNLCGVFDFEIRRRPDELGARGPGARGKPRSCRAPLAVSQSPYRFVPKKLLFHPKFQVEP